MLSRLTYNAARFAPAVRPAVLAPSSTLLAYRPLHSLASDKDGSAHQPAGAKSATSAPVGTRQYASDAPPAPNPNRLHADTSGMKPTTFWWPSSDTAWRDRKTGFKEISYVYTWPTVVCVLGAITAYYYVISGKANVELDSNLKAPPSPYRDHHRRV